METTKKYEYTNVIQQHYGYGWEDVSEYAANSKGVSKEPAHLVKWESGEVRKETLLKHDLREYKATGYPTRVIFRRTKILAQ